ncbi:ABC transporter permease [Paenibacillus sambharensis]|uniref:ABC transporter permease n=1 Tax=Paenibacillus sambharensis TaxID=1803190 RepID=A0A2W1LDZ2_9BACL|nr:ABC transporter permease [Paenibacillus sambharensis]PZD93275.1 ABC transporter permease [Paenibacillus sambharensis]
MGSKLRRGWPPLAVILLFLLAWQGVVMYGGIKPYLLPSPVQVVQEALSDKVWPRLVEHTLATAQRTLLGLSLGTAAGIVLSMLLHLVPGARRGLSPMLILSQNIPIIVLGPLLMIWLGFGELPKIVLIVLVCFFPVTVAMMTGLRQSDPRLANYLAMIGAGRWTMFRRLELPGAVPYLFSGMKIAAAYSVTSAIVAEWLGAKSGLGYFIKLSASGFFTARVLAATGIIVLFSLLLYMLVAAAERWFVRWKPQGEGGGLQP